MRLSFAATVLLLCFATASLDAADVKFVRVWPNFRTAESFMRLSEYFTGKENPGRKQTILRTEPEVRMGFYFLARLKNAGEALNGAKLELHLITPLSPRPVVYTFPADVPKGNYVYNLGLTGKDWPDPEMNPVAWRLVLVASDGQEIASEQSYLWSKPDKT
ncbi:MAG TPA: hypothetical protein VFT72_08715 [Opitutaceae bacterium]|nr:hypothetical protein [Opitutaceae bacterium]